MIFCINDKWIFRKRKVMEDKVKLRLFLFPPAGGDISIYQKWEDYLPCDIEICLVRLPGRGARINEPLIDDCKVLTEEIAEDIKQYLDRPYAFYGHSMGALIAYETAVLIYKSGLRLPERLFLSSLKAPDFMNLKKDIIQDTIELDENNLHLMSDEELKKKLFQIGGVDDIIWKDNDYIDTLLPIFRSDLKLCETFITEGVTRLPVPIDVYGGSSDNLASREDLENWRGCSKMKVTVTVFSGGHFYFNNMDRLFMFNLSKRLEEVIYSISDT
jgi:medium-chain acyl-[acyl-carrier-protein] hydrolase